jgi:putative membrane protein
LKESFHQELDQATKLAFDRTQLGAERTILAWVRTATSLITFGFAIYSFFGIPSGAGHGHVSHAGARIFALALIAIGLLALMFAAIQRQRDIKVTKLLYPGVKTVSMASTVGFMVAGLGVLALVILLLRV